MVAVQEPCFESHCFVVRNRKEVKVIDVEEVEMLRGLGHQSSIKAHVCSWSLG